MIITRTFRAVEGQEVSLPALPTQVKTLATGITKWAASGFKSVSPEILESRKATCAGCPEWNPQGFAGTGRCKKCGCSTQAKLRMATERCPLGKWDRCDSALNPPTKG